MESRNLKRVMDIPWVIDICACVNLSGHVCEVHECLLFEVQFSWIHVQFSWIHVQFHGRPNFMEDQTFTLTHTQRERKRERGRERENE